ncbi:MAG: hypothetical protein ACYTFO_04880 [Planctomycetota bacterium]|jgi:DNA-directed RNA polymerase subunit RPC12/RpoP
MRSYSAASWGPSVGAIAVLAGALAVWAGIGPGSVASNAARILAGIAAAVVGLSVVVLAAYSRVKRDAEDRKLHKYGCSRCGYEPHLNDIDSKEAYPCPRCDELIYE